MKKLATFFLFSLLLSPGSSQNYIFYLHGRIIEVQGPDAVDSINGFGAYTYRAILDSFSSHDFNVISEVRSPDTDVQDYAKTISTQVFELISKGVPASRITVIGASKGALIAMLVSGMVKNSGVNYVFMAACTRSTFTAFPHLNFYGNILSIYEKSDGIGSCIDFKERSTGISKYKEIELNTGLRHGFFYRPIPQWLQPCLAWAAGHYE